VIDRVISGASWSRHGQILSGRCKANNGTWFGITKGGRVAFLVNTSLLLDRVKSYSGSELYPVRFLEVWFVSISSFHLYISSFDLCDHGIAFDYRAT